MKKLLLPIVALLAFASVGFSQNCSQCDACTGSYITCASSEEDFWNDYNANCGPGPSIELQVLEGC